MTDQEFDQALIQAAFQLAAATGWSSVSAAAAARHAGLKLERARERFSGAHAILLRFGQLADELALSDAMADGPVRERIFDVLMRRFDALQTNRAGVLALLEGLPTDPATAIVLATATNQSMGWMLEAAGVPSTGWRGALARQGLTGVWLYTLRAWQKDETVDLSTTMAALDRALGQAERVAGWMKAGLFQAGGTPAEDGPKPFPEPAPEDEAALAGIISRPADAPLSDPDI